MSSENIHFEKILVDDQIVLIPDEAGWEALADTHEIDGLPFAVYDSTQNWLRDAQTFVANHSEFVLGIYMSGPKSPMPIVLFRMKDRWQRVHIEYPTCEVCGWHGPTAMPIAVDLYFGVPDAREAWNRAFGLPVVPCPRCHSQLPRYRHPIWPEPITKS